MQLKEIISLSNNKKGGYHEKKKTGKNSGQLPFPVFETLVFCVQQNRRNQSNF